MGGQAKQPERKQAPPAGQPAALYSIPGSGRGTRCYSTVDRVALALAGPCMVVWP